jgi:hypothetical protein
MPGDERELRLELLDVIRGKKPRTNFWKKPQGEEAYFSGQGSQNIWLFRWAIQLLLGMPTTSPDLVYAYQLGPGATGDDRKLVRRVHPVFGRRDFMLAIPQSGDDIVPIGFGGSEFGSSIYWFWHLIVHASLYRKGNLDVKSKALQWLVINWLYFRAIEAPDGGLLLAGMRSAGHDPCVPRETNWLWALVSGGNVAQAEAWCKQAGAGLKRSWEFEITKKLLPELRESWEAAKNIPIDRLQNAIVLRAPMTIIRTEGGLAWTIDHNVNPNTGPVLGMKWEHGQRMSFPDKGGARKRQEFDHGYARIEEDRSRMVYASSLYTDMKEIEMSLPGGDIIWKLRLGEGNGQSTSQPSQPDPVPMPPDSRPTDNDGGTQSADGRLSHPDRTTVIELLFSLGLSRPQMAERSLILPRIAAGTHTAEDVAAIRNWFPANNRLPRAENWRKALAILDGV